MRLILRLMMVCVLLFPLCMVASQQPFQPDYFSVPENVARAGDCISKELALRDIDYFVEKLDATHPAKNRYITEEDFQNLFDDIRCRLMNSEDSELKIIDLYYLLQELAASVKDVHTSIWKPIYDDGSLFPLKLEIIDGVLYCTGSLSGGETIPAGASVVSINGIRAEELLEEFAVFSNTPLPEASARYVEKSFGFHLAYLRGFTESFIVEYLYGGILHEKSISGCSAPQRPLPAVDSYEILAGDEVVPVLVLNRLFSDDRAGYFEFVDSFFDKYDDYDNIIIDIRQNTGGNSSWGNYVLFHFAGRQMKLVDNQIFLVSDYAREKVRFELHSRYYGKNIPECLWNSRVYYLVPGTTQLGKVVFGKNGDFIGGKPIYEINLLPRNSRYHGKVYLLIGEDTGSAAVDMASMFKYNTTGVVIGRETYHPDSFAGNITYHALPNSKIVFGLPISYTVAARGCDDGRGVIPDHEVLYSLDDLLSDRDRDLERVVKLISGEIQ